MIRKRIIVFTAVFALFLSVLGCGGAKKKEPSSLPDAGSEQETSPYGAEPTIPAEQDMSTGAGIPGGAGEEGPAEHRIGDNARGIYNDAVKAAMQGNLIKAEQYFQRVLKIDERAHLAAYNLGVLYERKGDDERAKTNYKEAFTMQPNYAPAIAAFSNLEIRRGNIAAAVDLLRERATRYSKNIGLLNRYADALIEAKRHTDAIATAKLVLKIDERNADAMLRIGKANLRLGRYELAESVFNQVLKIDPNQAEVYFLRAFIRLEEGQKAAAIEDFKTAIEKRPYYVEAMNNLATMYILSGNYAPAVETLKTAVDLAPSWGVLYLNFGNALRGAGRWQEAKDILKQAQSLDSGLKGAIFDLGLLYYVADNLDGLDRLGRLNESKRLFAQYKSAMGSQLSKDDPVHKYLKEIQIAVDREQQRIQAEKDRVEEEAKRAAEREAEAAKKDADAEKETGEKKEGEDEGWH